MNAKTRMLMTLLAIVLTFCLFSLEQSASAQSTNSNCKQLKGTEVDLFDPVAGVSNWTITNGGFLNGTTLWTFPSGAVFTPDPNVVAFLADITITTVDGQLKAHLVNTFNIVTGQSEAWGNIDPNTSTGRFAGATGVIFVDQGTPPPDISVGPLSRSSWRSNLLRAMTV